MAVPHTIIVRGDVFYVGFTYRTNTSPIMLLIAILLLSSAILSYAQNRDDQTVLKAFPSNIRCRRNAAQRRSELDELNRQLTERGETARSTLLVCDVIMIVRN